MSLANIWNNVQDDLALSNAAWHECLRLKSEALAKQEESGEYIKKIYQEFYEYVKLRYGVQAELKMLTDETKIIGLEVTYNLITGSTTEVFKIEDVDDSNKKTKS